MLEWTSLDKLRKKKPDTILLLITVIGVCIILGLSSIQTTYSCVSFVPESDTDIELNNPALTLSSDPTILINGNDDLAEQIGPLFVIADQVIDVTGAYEHAISISNTDTPFEIRDCILIGVENVSALVFYSVSNCTITNLTVISTTHTGIELHDVYNIAVTLSNVTDNHNGITITHSSYVEISNTTIESNSITGLFLDSSSRDNEIFWNTFDSNYFNAQDDDQTLSNNFTQNFWSDYLGEDLLMDRYGDSPYTIIHSQGNSDPLPFMLPPDRPPVYWRVTPADEFIEYGAAIVITLDASVNGGLEGWYLNDSRFTISDSGVISNDIWIPTDDYGFNITVRNLYYDTLSAYITLHVEDTIDPIWIETPTDQVVEIGDVFLYDVNATDLSIPLYFWLESSPYFEINSATGEIQNNDTLPAYVAHPVNVFIRDAEGNQINATFTVTPEDTRPPVLSESLLEQTIEYGTIFSYDIDASDFSGLDTWTINDPRFQIDNSGIVSNASTLDLGTYVLEVRVNDTIGNVLVDSFTVTVQDTIPPEWVVWPTNQILERGDSIELQLEVSDNAEIAYWTVSDSENFDITTLGRLFNIGTLDQVAYTLIVTAYDSSGNSVSAGFSITIQDTLNPTWTSLLDTYTFELGHLIRIPLDAHDYSGITGWTVEENIFFAIDYTGVITNATNLAVGTYTVHVSVSDIVGHILLGTISIEIVDTTAPLWYNVPTDLYVTAPDILTYLLSTLDYSGINRWEVNDTENFEVTAQGYLVGLRALPAGVYKLGITAIDPYGNNATVAITIHAFGHDITILALGVGLWGVAAVLLVLVLYIFNPKRGFFGQKGGSA